MWFNAMVDADEFLKQIKPAAKRSRLGPWSADIDKLRQNGCSLEQVREFLAINGVVVSVAAISKFIKRQENPNSADKDEGS